MRCRLSPTADVPSHTSGQNSDIVGRMGPSDFAERTLWNVEPSSCGSVHLDAGELNHLGPFLGFVGDERAEVGGRARKARHRPDRQAAPSCLGSARPALISLLSFSTISGGVFLGRRRPASRSPRSPARNRRRSGCPAAPPSASQGHRQRAQLARPDMPDR